MKKKKLKEIRIIFRAFFLKQERNKSKSENSLVKLLRVKVYVCG